MRVKKPSKNSAPDTDTSKNIACLDVALDVPLRQSFSYLYSGVLPQMGARVKVPFGRRKMIGVVVGHQRMLPSQYKLKAIIELIDQTPLFSKNFTALVQWSAHYYHHPLGEVWHSAMPAVLRQGLPELHGLESLDYSVAKLAGEAGQWEASLQRAPVQKQIMQCLLKAASPMSQEALHAAFPKARSAILALTEKGYIQTAPSISKISPFEASVKPHKLNQDQAEVVKKVIKGLGQFQCFALEGVTGSGKTEVYFSAIDAILAQDKQALVMLPEIALTDQHFDRFRQRFGSRVAQVHSGMSNAARYHVWWHAKQGNISIVLGTRSSVFMVFSKLGLIIIDEEHDASYKQQEGLRYHARSMALKRGQNEGFPVVLGSATLALETQFNIGQGRYQKLSLSKRASQGEQLAKQPNKMPKVELVDLNHHAAEEGLSQPLLKALTHCLEQKQQALVFINRRGYAPVLYCQSCQWTANCKRCDAQMTTHQNARALQCHHCGASRPAPLRCDSCHSEHLVPLGEGTQKIEETIKAKFPKARVQRFDRDVLSSATAMKTAMDAVHDGKLDILVGTQLLSKGHDFSNVNLVLVINADQGLYSLDFRAVEQTVSQMIQVAGRAGRGEAQGQVLIQTHFPQHPALLAVKAHDFSGFVQQELLLRESAAFPPFAHIALWRVRGREEGKTMKVLRHIHKLGKATQPENTLCFDPVKSVMFKRKGQYHAQLLISAQNRSSLHIWLAEWVALIEKDKLAKQARWSIDVDPISLL